MRSEKQEQEQEQGHRSALMEYDDLQFMNDDLHEVSKGNFHLDTEVRQAGLTRFDIEENLEVQLRFDGLDEAHILLGESGHCEDHWGSGFCRQDNTFELETTSHNIAFSSNGENTYKSSSLLRPINVWSEATSSESVQMLLNSIRQDEMNLTTEGNLFGPDIGELISSPDNRAEINMWSVSKSSKRESLPSRLPDISGDEFENTSENKHEFENTGKKNHPASEQSVMDVREDTKELPILSNGSAQCGSLFAVNSSSVTDCMPAQKKCVPMIGVCFDVNKFKQDTHDLAPNTDSTQEVNAENKNGGNEDFGSQTEGAEKAEDEMLSNSLWAEETERMCCGKFLEFQDRREGKRGKLQITDVMPPERTDLDSLVQSQHEASNAFGQADIQLSDSVWDEGDSGSQEKQLDRVSQEDILSSEMQGLSELCSYKRDENSVQEASQYGFMMFDMQRIQNCTSNEEEQKICIGSKNWMEAGSEQVGDLSPFTRIEKRLDNATLDISSHEVRTDFKHTHIQGMPDSLLDENKKENVEEQFIESYGDCVAVEKLSGASEKGAKEVTMRVTMKGIPESLLDESNQTRSVVPPEDTVLADIEEMPDLIFDVSKEDQTTMHAKEPSRWDHLPAKIERVLDQSLDGEKQSTSVGCLNNLDASDNAEGEMCEFSRNRDRSVEEARENNTVNGSSYEVMDVLGQRESRWVSGSVVKHVKEEESLENVQKAEMRGGLDSFLDERSEYARITTDEDIAFVNVHSMELVIDVNDKTDVEMHATQVDCKNAVTEAVCSVSDFMLDEKKEVKGGHDLCEPADEGKEKITKYPSTGDCLNAEARICNMGRSSQEKNPVFGLAEIQGTLKSLVGATDMDNAGKYSREALHENDALVEKQGVSDSSPCKSIAKNAMLVEKRIVLDLSLDETSENDVRMHTTYALDEAAAPVHLQIMPLYARNEKSSEASVEEMEEMPDRLSEKYKAGKSFAGACQDAVLESQIEGMSSSILDENSQAIPQKHAMETAEADITMVGMQEVSKTLVHINENPQKQEFEGLQESHLDAVELLGNDNEQTVGISPWILEKPQIADVLTKGKSLTKIRVNRHNENIALLKESGSGYKNVKKEEFAVIDVEIENDNECVQKRKTPEYAQVSVTEVLSASLSQREEDSFSLSSSLVLQTSENMAHTYKEKLASSMEKAEIIYMDSGASGFMASEVREPEDISRLHVGSPTAFVSPRTTSVDTVLHSKDITEPSKANCANRKPLSVIQGREVQEEDGHASPHKRKASLEKHLSVGSAFYVITCNSNSPGCEEAAVQTLQVLPLANLQAEKACDQAIHYHNSGSQIVKALGTDVVTLQNVQDLNVPLLTELEKSDKSIIANLSESDAVKNSECEKISTSIESLPFHKESAIDACRRAMQIAKMSMAAENGDIDKTIPLAEEPENVEKAAQLTPEATYHRKLNDLTFPMEKSLTDGYQQAMQIAQFSMKIVDSCAMQTEHSNIEFQKSGEAVVISMDMESDHTRQTVLMNGEFEESGKAVGTSTEIEDDLTQQTGHMNPESGENVEVTRTSIEIKNSLTKGDLMNLESEHSFRTATTSMKIENDNDEKACLINQESEISINVGCTAFEATAQDGRQPKSCNEQNVLTSDSGNPSTQGGGKLHCLENLEKDVMEATIAGLYVQCMSGKVADKDEEEIEKDKFKVETSEIGLESVSSTIGECELSLGSAFPGDGKESANECDFPLVQCSCKSKDVQVGAGRLKTRIQTLGSLSCKDAEVASKKFEAGIQQSKDMMACNSMSQSDGISTIRVHSGKVISEGSRKSPAIMPNSEHGKPLKARKPKEIFQNNVSEDLTECRGGQPEGSNMTKTFRNEVENNGTQNSVVCEMHSMLPKGNYYQTASEANKEKSHLVVSLNELDRSSDERPETGFCITADVKGAPMSSENHSLRITFPSCACHPDISKQCPLLSNVSARTLSDLNTTAVPVPASIQQPFTDSQQLQLRAQILVYGSLIQGSLPEESLMIVAFGDIIATYSGSVSSNQRENLWEQSWRLAAAKLQGKIFTNACEVHTPKTSLLDMSSVLASTMFEGGMRTVSPAVSLFDSGVMGMRSVDLAAAKGHSSSSRSESSPNIGRVGHMDNPSAIMTLPSPFSSPSPVWSMSTPIREGVQRTNVARNLYLDSPQITPSRHSSLTPQLGKYAMGSTAYWTSCSPSLPWVTSRAKSESELSFSPFAVPEPIHETLNDWSSVPLFVPYKTTTPLVPSVSSTMIGTTIPQVGTNNKMEAQKGGMGIERQLSIEQRPKKRRKSRVLEGIVETSRLTRPASGGSIPLPTSQVVLSEGSLVVARNSHDGGISNSFLTTGSSMPFVPSPSYYQIISRGEGEHRVIFSEETASCIEQARLYAEEAASFAATAVKHSQFIWSQLVAQADSVLSSDCEAKLASSAAAASAAASVAKAAAAAAKVAHEAALQAKLVATEALNSNNASHGIQSGAAKGGNQGHQGQAIHKLSSITKGRQKDATPCLLMSNACLSINIDTEAVSAATKRAQNLNAIERAAGLASEAVSQAGAVIAMGDPVPLSLNTLLEAGPDGYWKLGTHGARVLERYDGLQAGVQLIKKDGIENSEKSLRLLKEKENKEVLRKETLKEVQESVQDSRRDFSKWLLNDLQRDIHPIGEDCEAQKENCVPDSIQIGMPVVDLQAATRKKVVRPEDEPATNLQEDSLSLKSNQIRDGSLVEVVSDEEGLQVVWFSAKVLSLQAGKALVRYDEHSLSDNGSIHLQEWIPLKGDSGKAPRIRMAHHMIAMKCEGMRKRRREAMSNHVWSVGDHVDAWIHDGWREGIITGISEEDENGVTVSFPGKVDTLLIKAWNLRPSLVWKDGQWVEWTNSNVEKEVAHEDDVPLGKRQKVDKENTIRKEKSNDNLHRIPNVEEGNRDQEPSVVISSAKGLKYSVVKISREGRSAMNSKAHHAEQTEASRFHGLPKPAKKKKFMDVSRHYSADKMVRNSPEGKPTNKMDEYKTMLSHSQSGLKTNKFEYLKAKKTTFSKPRELRFGKEGQNKAQPEKDKSYVVNHRAIKNTTSSHEFVMGHTPPISIDGRRAGRKVVGGDASSLFDSVEVSHKPSSFTQGKPFSAVDADQGSKRKTSRLKSSSQNSENNIFRQEKTSKERGPANVAPDHTEPRRSNRRFQPTSRLLEGLQSLPMIVKSSSIFSHEKGGKAQSEYSSSISKGNASG